MTNHHAEWKKRQKLEIEAAIGVYKESLAFDESVDLEKIGEKIFDILTEEDWERLNPKLKKIKEEANLFSGE
jgi:hypothetical protein